MAKNVLVLKHFESPKEAGVYHRLVCLTGGNKGESYVLLGNRIVLGRGEKADIRLTDIKSSREHAEITKVGDNWVVTDLGSQNGIIVNDKKVIQETLVEGDKLIIGQTVLKFARVEVAGKKVIKEAGKDDEAGEKKKSLVPVIVIAGIFAALFLLPDNKNEENNEPAKRVKAVQDVSNEYVNAVQKRNAAENKQLKEKLVTIYQRGQRELREKNYFRAIHEFNLALIIAPGDAQAEYYLRKAKEGLDKEIDGYIAKAQRDEESLKFKSAIISYCSIVRLLYSVPEDLRHKNAVKQIKELEQKIGLEPGETDCIKKQPTSI